jgi:hypothetical protein
MDDKKEEKKVEGTTDACVSKGGCGMHCGCCACKAIKGLVLLLIGGFIGFGIAHCYLRHSWMHRMCRTCPMETAAPAQSESAPMPTAAPKKGK